MIFPIRSTMEVASFVRAGASTDAAMAGHGGVGDDTSRGGGRAAESPSSGFRGGGLRSIGWRGSLAFCLALQVGGCTVGGTSPGLPDARFEFDGNYLIDGGGEIDADTEACTAESMGATLGLPCSGSGQCDDGCYCNGVEVCAGGTCIAGNDPCADDVPCTEEMCSEIDNQCTPNLMHSMCDDGDACNGAEQCDPFFGCLPASPLYCNDEDSCTVDRCDVATGCVHEVRDLDRDGYTDGRCGGDDCDDDPRFGPDIHPGADEDCENRRDDDCDGLRDYNDPTCVPTNDRCETARDLPGPGTYSGATRGLEADYPLGCMATGLDAVFRISLTESQDVRLGVLGGSGVAVALRPWNHCGDGPDMKCAATAASTVLAHSVAPGSYAIIVKTSSGIPFDLSVAFSAPTPAPSIDVCDAETDEITATGIYSGMFYEVADDYALSCHTGAYRDAAYRLRLTEPQDLVVTANSTGTWPTAYVALTTNCAEPGQTLLCQSGRPASLRRRELPAGTYYLLLESSAVDAGTWTLDVSLTPPVPRTPGDTCSGAVPVTPSAPGMAALDTADLDVPLSCAGSTTFQRDVFFTFSLARTRDVEFTIDAASSAHFVGLTDRCGVAGRELTCRSASSPATQVWRSLAPGRYYVTVATTARAGNVTASMRTAAPTPVPPNDRCDGAIDIGGGYASRDTLVGFGDDARGCSGFSYPDAFYRLVLRRRQNVTVVASQASGSGSMYLTLRDTCAGDANLACHTGAPTAVIDRTLAAGTYYVLVESPGSTAGDFQLTVVVRNP